MKAYEHAEIYFNVSFMGVRNQIFKQSSNMTNIAIIIVTFGISLLGNKNGLSLIYWFLSLI